MPIPLKGDRAAHDVINYPELHAADLEAGAPLYHLPDADTDQLAIFDGAKWVGIDKSTVGGGGGGDLYFVLDGALVTGSSVVPPIKAARALTIASIVLYLAVPGSSGSTTIDVKKNGVSLFPTATKPTVAFGDADHSDERVPDTTAIAKGDILSLDVISAAQGAQRLAVAVVIASASGGSSSGGGGSGDMSKSVYDPNDDGSVAAADSVPWAGITGKPATFTPGPHDHDDRYYTETELQTSGQASVHWDNITNKPVLSGSTVSQVIFTAEGALTAGSGVLRIYNCTGSTKTITKVFLSVAVPPTGAPLVVDVRKNTASLFLIQANKPQIAVNAFTGQSTSMDTTAWADGEYLTMDIVSVGSVNSGSNLTVHIVYE